MQLYCILFLLWGQRVLRHCPSPRSNEGWEWQALDPDQGAAEEEYIRGFRVVRRQQQLVQFEAPGQYTVP